MYDSKVYSFYKTEIENRTFFIIYFLMQSIHLHNIKFVSKYDTKVGSIKTFIIMIMRSRLMFQLFVQWYKLHIPSSVPGQMGNDSSQDFGEFIILFNGLLKEFSWHRAVIIYTMEIKGNQISWNFHGTQWSLFNPWK